MVSSSSSDSSPGIVFPCLSCLRADASTATVHESSFRSSIDFDTLEARLNEIQCSPISSIQAAWASILLAYGGSESQEVAFGIVTCDQAGSSKAPSPDVISLSVQSQLEGREGGSLNVDILRQLSANSSSRPEDLQGDGSSNGGNSFTGDTVLAVRSSLMNYRLQSDAYDLEALLAGKDYAVVIELWLDTDGRLSARTAYTNKHLDDTSACMMLEQFCEVLEWITTHPERRFLDTIDCVKEPLQSASNASPINELSLGDQSPLLQSQFESFARSCPKRKALVFKSDLGQISSSDTEWTYDELNTKSSAFAAYLIQSFGSVLGAIIPICMEKRAELYIAVLGILKAGAAWCPIDSSSPAGRRRDLIARIAPRILVIAQEDAMDLGFVPEGLPIVNLASLNISLLEDNHQILPTHSAILEIPLPTAYVIWTSGTTGPPKGVSVSHQAAVTSMRALQTIVPTETRSDGGIRCIQFSQHTFDVFVQDLFYTWGAGGTLIASSRELMNDSFADLATITGATHAHLTPAFAGSIPRRSCPTLEVVTMIGEKLPQHVADDWGEAIQAYNTYGPAEAAVVATVRRFFGKEDKLKSANIGKPLPSVSCYVLRNGSVVMKGAVGELALGGYQLASGYLQDLARTSEKFVWHSRLRERIYLTGDIVRMLGDGTIEFLGRNDDLVKLAGIRVELSEVSFSLLNCHPLAEDIVTCYFSRADRPKKSVVSFIAISGASSKVELHGLIISDLWAAEIAACALKHGRNSLPDFMVPSVFIIIKKIPRTPSAKVDRVALQALFESLDLDAWEIQTQQAERGASERHDEWNETEASILSILSRISKVDVSVITPASSLRALGIDSIHAGLLAKSLRNSHHHVTAAAVLRSRTIQDLLVAVKEQQTQKVKEKGLIFDIQAFDKSWRPIVKAVTGYQDIIFVMPALPLQEGLLSESMADGRSYWNHFLYDLDDHLDLDRLRGAWQNVSDGNEALRVSFLPTSEISLPDRPSQSSSSFLQLVYKSILVEWSIVVSGENDLSLVATNTASTISDKHHEKGYTAPLWEVTILEIKQHRIMMLTIHHALHDAISIEFILRDLWSAYNDHGLRGPSRRQLRDAVSVSLEPDIREAENEKKFWSALLADFIDLETPTWPDLTERQNPSKPNCESPRLSFRLKLALSDIDLTAASRSLSVSPIAIIQAAFGTLLLDYLETSKIVFGEVISSRNFYTDVEDAVAPLIALVPVPFRAKSSPRLLISDQDRLASRIRHRRNPPGILIRKLLQRPQLQPLYPAVFVFHPEAVEHDSHDKQSRGWTAMGDEINLSVEHTLALNVSNKAGWWLEFSADAAYMTIAHLKVLAEQTNALVMAMIKSPDSPIIGLLDESSDSIISISKSRLPIPENHMSALFPTYWVDYYAIKQPDWIAVEVASKISEQKPSTEKWNYSTLLAEASSIAAYICGLDYQKSIIALCAGRTLASYAAILGILKSGNTYLPIDDRLPMERKSLLLKDSCCRMLFTDSECAKFLGPSPPDCLIVNLEDWDVYERSRSFKKTHSLPKIDPQDTAYILYTSGSTGTPKGVLISHQSLCGFVEGMTDVMGKCSPKTTSKAGVGKWLGLASRAFDVHLAEMFLAWRSGLAAITAPRELLLDNLRLALDSLGVTHACFVPSLVEQAGLEPNDVPQLVFMTVGGEKLSRRIVDVWTRKEGLSIVNAYGPTELAIGCSAAMVSAYSKTNNIGHPYGNTAAHVLLPNTSNYAIRGQPGELCFTGCLVGNGYLDRPDAKGFVDDFKGQRMYRTGDMARMMADGSLEYLGRGDDQTKIRGQRIELSEISETIRISHDHTVDVATLVVSHPDLLNNVLASFVSDATERSKRYGAKPVLIEKPQCLKASRIQDACRQKLPAFMVPDYVLLVDVIPLASVSGKADGKLIKTFFSSISLDVLLGTLELDSSTSKRDFTPAEIVIRDVVRSTIGLDESHIAYDTNLFSLGLDSLSVVGLSIKLRKLGFGSNLQSILRNPTVAGIASLRAVAESTQQDQIRLGMERLATFESRALRDGTFHLATSEIESVRPCLPMQEGVIASSLNGDSANLYVNHVLFELQDSLNLEHLKATWNLLAEESPILRTCFEQYEDKIIQVVLKPASYSLIWDVKTYPQGQDILDKLRDWRAPVSEEIVNSLFFKPPIRFREYHSTGQKSLLLVSIHHSIYDGESFQMMIEDVYNLLERNRRPNRVSFDMILGHQLIHDQEDAKDFWKRHLSGSCFSGVSGQRRFGNITQSELLTQPLKLKGSELRRLAANFQVSIATLLQSAFGITLAILLGQNDITFGVVLSGRTIPVEGADTVMAPCVTTIPQRMQLKSVSATFADTAREVQKSSTESLLYQHTPLRQISRWIGVAPPLFDCLFSFTQGRRLQAYSGLWKQIDSSMTLDYPLAMDFEAEPLSDTLSVTSTFNPAFGSKEKVERFVESMEILLKTLLRGEPVSISSLGLSQGSDGAHLDSSHKWSEQDWNEKEQEVRKIVAEFSGLRTEQITKNGSFFQFSIDSVSAIRLAQKLRDLGFRVRSSTVMQYPCVGALCSYLSREQAPHDSTSSIALKSNALGEIKHQLDLSEKCAIYPCTPLQTGMITATLASGGSLYVHSHRVRMGPGIDLSKLRKAWTKVSSTLDILRTSFHFVLEPKAAWIAAVHENQPENWKEWPGAEVIQEIMQYMVLQSDSDFNRPPVQAHVAPTQDGYILHLLMHHALYDGVSIRMIFNELASSYKDMDNQESSRPEFMSAARMISENQSSSIQFWANALRDYRLSDLMSTPDIPKTKSKTARALLSLDATEVAEKCKALGVTLQTLALVAFGKAMICISGQRDVVFGHVVAGRSLPIDGCQNIVGPLFNTLPFRLRLDNPFETNGSVLQRVQDFTAEAQPHQHAPLQYIQQDWRQRTTSSARLFEALFLLEKAEDRNLISDDLWTPCDPEPGISGSEYGLNFEITQKPDFISIQASCTTMNLLGRDLVDILNLFESCLLDMIDHPARLALAFPAELSNLPLINQETLHENAQIMATEPRDPGFDVLCQVLSDISDVPTRKIFPATTIYSLGLDSISAIKVASKCRGQNLSISVADVLQGVTLAGIWKRVQHRDNSASPMVSSLPTLAFADFEGISVAEADVQAILPCLSGQGYYLSCWLASGKTFGEATFVHTSKKLDVERLKDAWNKLKARHTILRTTFHTVSSLEVIQIVTKPCRNEDNSFEVRQGETNLQALRGEVKLLRDKCSDFKKPPVSLRVVQGSQNCAILLTMHHAAYDAWTIPILLRDLSDIYQNFALVETPSYTDFVGYTIGKLHALDEETYWKQRLEGHETTLIGRSGQKSSLAEKRAPKQSMVSLEAIVENAPELALICRSKEVSLPCLILLAYARILGRTTKVSNPTFGYHQAGRSASFPGLDRLSGPCLNVTPMTVPSALEDSVLEAARRIQADLASRAPFEQSSLPSILKWMGADGKAPFNAYINILWHAEQTRAPSDSIFAPIDVGPPSDFCRPERFECATPVDGLRWPVAKEALHVDVSLRPDMRTVDLGARAEGELVAVEQLREWLAMLASEIRSLVASLQDGS